MMMALAAAAGLVVPLLPTGALVNVGIGTLALCVMAYQAFTRPATFALFVGSAAYAHTIVSDAHIVTSLTDYYHNPAVTALALLALWLTSATAVALMNAWCFAAANAVKDAIVATLRFVVVTIPLTIIQAAFKLIFMVLKLIYATVKLGVALVIKVLTIALQVVAAVVKAVANTIKLVGSLVAAVVKAPFQAASYLLTNVAAGSLPNDVCNMAVAVVTAPMRFLLAIAGAIQYLVGSAVSGTIAAAKAGAMAAAGAVLALLAVAALPTVSFPQGFIHRCNALLRAGTNKLFGGPRDEAKVDGLNDDGGSEAGDDDDDALATTTTTFTTLHAHRQVENGLSTAAATTNLSNSDGVILNFFLALLRAGAELLFGGTTPTTPDQAKVDNVPDEDSEAGSDDDDDDALGTAPFVRDFEDDDALGTIPFVREVTVQAPARRPAETRPSYQPYVQRVERALNADKRHATSTGAPHNSSKGPHGTALRSTRNVAAAGTAASSRSAVPKASRAAAAAPASVPMRAASSQRPRSNRQEPRSGKAAAGTVRKPTPATTTRKTHSEVRRLALQSLQAQKKRDLAAMGGGDAQEAAALPKRKKTRRS